MALIDDFQTWLDRRTQGFFDRDIDALMDLIELPGSMTTRKAVLMITTPHEARIGFEAWSDMLRNQGATHMISVARSVFEIDEDLMSGQYETFLMRDANLLCSPYKNTATLRRRDGVWRAVSISTGLNNISWPITVPRVEDDGSELHWSAPHGPEEEDE